MMINIPNKKYSTDFESIIKSLLLTHSSIKYEIEARIGKIYNKETESRMKINSLIPILYTKLPRGHSFIPGVDPWDFKILQQNLVFKEHIEDQFRYLENGNRIRYINNEYRFCEKKRKILVLDVYMPYCKYDVRISVMEEMKLMQRFTQSPVQFIRYRDRKTLTDKYFNYDFTRIRKDGEETYEVEIEVDDMNYKIEDFLESFYKINVVLE